MKLLSASHNAHQKHCSSAFSPRCDWTGWKRDSSSLLLATGALLLHHCKRSALLLAPCISRFTHMFHALLYTCLSPIHVTSHIQSHSLCLSISHMSSEFKVASFLSCYRSPMRCPTPPAPWPTPHPTHYTASPLHLLFFSPFIFSSLPLCSCYRAFSTSSESRTSWIIYLRTSVGDFAAFPHRLPLKDRQNPERRKPVFSFKCAGERHRCSASHIHCWALLPGQQSRTTTKNM